MILTFNDFKGNALVPSRARDRLQGNSIDFEVLKLELGLSRGICNLAFSVKLNPNFSIIHDLSSLIKPNNV